MALTKQELVEDLRRLGVEPGMVLMVHSSLSALGVVEGGADTVIDALEEVVGAEGTLMMPAMGGADVFDVTKTPSGVGSITDRFWRRPEVTRSIHPTHSAAGVGPLVGKLLDGHIDQPTAIGPDSPWGRVAQLPNGYLLFLGCDQDRNTLLHTAEDIVDGAYLHTIERAYYDEQRSSHVKTLERFPGPHRDFIQLDRLFRDAGAMRVGHVGRAVARLMNAGEVLRLAIEALRRDPAAVLCDNPHCMDCVTQRAAIKRERLSHESFRLSALLTDVYPPDNLDLPLWDIQAEGIGTVEVSASMARSLQQAGSDTFGRFVAMVGAASLQVAVWPCEVDWEKGPAAAQEALSKALGMAGELRPQYVKLSPFITREADAERAEAVAVEVLKALAASAEERGVTLLIENHSAAVWRDQASCAAVLKAVEHERLRFAFNPRHFAHVRENPFLRTWTRGKLKRYTAQVLVSDGCWRPGWPSETLPSRGQAEVKEIISILRCRSFEGLLTIVPGTGFSFTEAAEAFWRMLDRM